MRKSLRFIVPTLIFMIMCLTMLAPTALAAENPSVAISATVKLTGTLPAVPENFSVKLSADELSNSMPAGSLNGISTMIVNGAGTVTFPEITFAKVGIYKYTIWQQSGSDPDCQYDTTIYHLTVYVLNADGGGLETTSVIYKEGETEKCPAIVFHNKYADPAEVKLRALKTLDGKTPSNGSFTFLLTDKDGKILQTKTNLGQDVTFDTILLKEAGTHIFYIKEKKGTNSKIIYDAAVYKVTVVVTKNSDGDYKAVISYEKAGKHFTGIPFFGNKTIRTPLPNTGEAQSALPILGVVLLIGGVALSMKRNTSR